MERGRQVPVEKTGTPAPQAPSGAHPLVSLRGEIDRLFDDFFRGWPSLMSFPSRLFDFDPFRRSSEPLATTFGTLAPRVDVAQTDQGYEIEAELPGMDEKDLNVTVSDGVLTIRGEKKAEREEKKKDYYLSERSYGTLQRSFRLPESVDAEKISAEFKKGVLTISLPKSKEAKEKERKITIKSA
ncbi:MAG TPA: Hsp20/alpha crystallin family protein [Alphaproteobacteria bacterium]|nr:Hsp20/alpha crystallin family protein [Alphaproteobacteria bacterium]